MQRLNRVSLRSLRAVEAVARLGSLARAADELRISPGAVSQQVASAEVALSLTIFDRGRRGMTISPDAEEFCSLLASGFSQISQAIALSDRRDEEVLTVSVAPIFASRWLIWRLTSFQSSYPDIRVRLDASLGLVDPRHSDVDLCIRVGRGGWQGVSAERLFSQVIFPVCAPKIAEQITSIDDLESLPIVTDANAMFSWADWLLPGELSAERIKSSIVVSDSSLCLDAAIAGIGVFLSFETLAAEALSHGRLVEPFGRRRATRNSYWLVSAEGRLRRPARVFRDWLKQEIDSTGFGEEHDVEGGCP